MIISSNEPSPTLNADSNHELSCTPFLNCYYFSHLPLKLTLLFFRSVQL